MEILDRKSEAIHFFLGGLEEMLNVIEEALKHRTPHLNGEKFLTGKDVCGMLHVSPRTLQEWRTKGKMPFLRLKGKILYKQSDVLEWLNNSYLQPIE